MKMPLPWRGLATGRRASPFHRKRFSPGSWVTPHPWRVSVPASLSLRAKAVARWAWHGTMIHTQVHIWEIFRIDSHQFVYSIDKSVSSSHNRTCFGVQGENAMPEARFRPVRGCPCVPGAQPDTLGGNLARCRFSLNRRRGQGDTGSRTGDLPAAEHVN